MPAIRRLAAYEINTFFLLFRYVSWSLELTHVEDEILRRGAERGPRHDTRLAHARFREVAHAAGEDRPQALQLRRRERRIVLRLDRLQLALQHVGVDRPAGHVPGERGRGVLLVARRAGRAAERLPLGDERRRLSGAGDPAAVHRFGRLVLD